MLALPVKLMAKQQCTHCIDANSACETDGQTTISMRNGACMPTMHIIRERPVS